MEITIRRTRDIIMEITTLEMAIIMPVTNMVAITLREITVITMETISQEIMAITMEIISQEIMARIMEIMATMAEIIQTTMETNVVRSHILQDL